MRKDKTNQIKKNTEKAINNEKLAEQDRKRVKVKTRNEKQNNKTDANT